MVTSNGRLALSRPKSRGLCPKPTKSLTISLVAFDQYPWCSDRRQWQLIKSWAHAAKLPAVASPSPHVKAPLQSQTKNSPRSDLAVARASPWNTVACSDFICKGVQWGPLHASIHAVIKGPARPPAVGKPHCAQYHLCELIELTKIQAAGCEKGLCGNRLGCAGSCGGNRPPLIAEHPAEQPVISFAIGVAGGSGTARRAIPQAGDFTAFPALAPPGPAFYRRWVHPAHCLITGTDQHRPGGRSIFRRVKGTCQGNLHAD